jgi:hypothetical protein
MNDEFSEFIKGTGMTDNGPATIRICPFCGISIHDYEHPAGFALHVWSTHGNDPNWEKVMRGRKKPV